MYRIKDGMMRRYLTATVFETAFDAERWARTWIGACGFVVVRM